jgi:spore germination protein GerM
MGHHNPFEAQLWLVRNPGGRVAVEAFEYSAKDGSVQKLTRKSVDLAIEPIRVTLYFPLSDCGQVTAFTRELPKSTAMARLLVEALLAGPVAAERGATSPFPEGSDLRSVNLREGVLTVDFNERLQNVGGSCRAVAIREAVTRTLGQLPTVKRVVITAGGREDLALQP